MPVNQFTPGINYPSGFQVANPFPLDAYLGPYPGGSTTAAWTEANNKISGANRYQGMQVILLAPDGGATVAYKYWYRGGTADNNLVEFASGAGGAAFDSSTSYTWTAPQYFSAGFSAAGGVTFTSLTHFTAGLSASGAITALSGICSNGLTLSSGTAINILTGVGGYAGTFIIGSRGKTSNVAIGFAALASGAEPVVESHFGEMNTAIGHQALGQVSTNGSNSIGNVGIGAGSLVAGTVGVKYVTAIGYNAGSVSSALGGVFGNVIIGACTDVSTSSDYNSIIISGMTGSVSGVGGGSNTTVIGNSQTTSTRVFGLLHTNGGISASGATFGSNVHVGGTLSVDGNFYVAGTMTTVNESQLLIQDKYLVLGSTLGNNDQYGTSAGIYVGSTTDPIASFAYLYDGTTPRWVSNVEIFVNGNQLLTNANLSSQTGLTAESLNVLGTSNSGTYYFPMLSGFASGSAYRVYTEEGISFDANTNTLSCTKIEAIVDGGTWS